MSSVRNTYIYLTTAISLQSFTWALIAMLRNFVITDNIRFDRSFLAFQIAVILIGLPIFLIHWQWAQRLSAADKEEQRSALRRFYLYATLAALLIPMLTNTFGLFAYQLADLLDGALPHFLVTVVPLAVLFYYHHRLLDQDTLAFPPLGVNARIRRLYHFAFSAAGLWMTTQAVINLVYWLQLQASPPSMTTRVFSDGLTPEIVRLLMGTAIWLIFWRWIQNAFASPSDDEKQSLIRKGYLYLVVFVTSLGAVGAATAILDGYFRRILLESSTRREGPELGYAIIVGMGISWAYHAYILRQDAAATSDSLHSASVRRIYLYLIAGVGLAAFLAGLTGDVMALIDTVTTSNAFGNSLREQVSWATAAIIAGLPVWILPWRSAQLEALNEEDALAASNRRSTTRKIYLYFYLFFAVMSLLGGLIAIVYQILLLVLGERSDVGLLNDLARAFSIALIGAGVLGYHGKVLRGDGRLEDSGKDARLQDFNLAILDKGDGQFGLALKQALATEFPHLNLIPIGLTKPASNALEMTIKPKDAPKQIAAADLIVGPWDITVDDGDSSAITAAVISSPAAKLLAPTRKPGWDWAGVDEWNNNDIVEQTVKAVKQFLEGDQVKLARGLGLAAIAFLVIAGLCFLSFVFSFVGELLF